MRNSNLKFIVLAVLVLAALCALVAADTKDTLTCETNVKYRCPKQKEWRCQCPQQKDWCWKARACVPKGTAVKEHKPECNNRCVYGKIENVKGYDDKYYEKCTCKRGWSGPYCNQKEVNLKYSKKYHKECGKDLECKKKITVKCRCNNRYHSDYSDYSSSYSSYSDNSSSDSYDDYYFKGKNRGWGKHKAKAAKAAKPKAVRAKAVKANAVKQANIGLNAEQKLE